MAKVIGSCWAGRPMPGAEPDRLRHRGGGGERDVGIGAAQVLLAELGAAGRRRGPPAGRDVGVLGDVERVEAASLGLAGDLDGLHRLVGRVDRDADLHALLVPRLASAGFVRGQSYRSWNAPRRPVRPGRIRENPGSRPLGRALYTAASAARGRDVDDGPRDERKPEVLATAQPFDADYTLEDRYRVESGRVFLTGNQALVRLPLMQRQRDLAAGLNTEGFISGYRGSPLGIFDMNLWQAKDFLDRNRIRFEPGLNEDLAATAVWGSQQATLLDGPEGRWRLLHVVRQGARCRSLLRCPEARELRGDFAEGRRARADGRRPGREILVDRAPERAGVDPLRDPDPESLERPGLRRPRTLRLGAVALFGLLGRLQVSHRHDRELGLGRGLARSGSDRHARRFRDAARRAAHRLGESTAGRSRSGSSSSAWWPCAPSRGRTGSIEWCSRRRDVDWAS